MINLIKKDLKLSGKINIFIVVYALFIATMGLSMPVQTISTLLYILGMIILIFVAVIYTNGYDDKYKSEVVLNSFPIDRKDIVKGKYLMLIIFIIIGCSSVIIFTNVISLMGIVGVNNRTAGIWDAILVTNISLIFYSIYYPFYFRIGEGLRSFNIILWMLMAIGPAIINRLVNSLERLGYLEKILSINLNRINIYLLIFSIGIYYISMQISKSIYINKEF